MSNMDVCILVISILKLACMTLAMGPVSLVFVLFIYSFLKNIIIIIIQWKPELTGMLKLPWKHLRLDISVLSGYMYINQSATIFLF